MTLIETPGFCIIRLRAFAGVFDCWSASCLCEFSIRGDSLLETISVVRPVCRCFWNWITYLYCWISGCYSRNRSVKKHPWNRFHFCFRSCTEISILPVHFSSPRRTWHYCDRCALRLWLQCQCLQHRRLRWIEWAPPHCSPETTISSNFLAVTSSTLS